tara:strand:- start:26 stop:265 length:240 start_codon:yes stop_codon:yes gene_type:complete
MNDYYKGFNQMVNKQEEKVLKREIKKARNKKRINVVIPHALDIQIDQVLLELKKENHNTTKQQAIVKILTKGCKEWNNQ